MAVPRAAPQTYNPQASFSTQGQLGCNQPASMATSVQSMSNASTPAAQERAPSPSGQADGLPMTGRRIGLLSGVLSPRNGGVFEAVLAQASVIDRLGGTPVILGIRDDGADPDLRLSAWEVHACPQAGPAQLGYAPKLALAARGAGLDLLHLHGIWQATSHSAARWARATSRPLLISPHGMLDPWITARGRFKKAIASALFERRCWRLARGFHALTAAEADHTRQTTNIDASAMQFTIPNAAPPPGPARKDTPQPAALYLGRIHSKKNLALRAIK